MSEGSDTNRPINETDPVTENSEKLMAIGSRNIPNSGCDPAVVEVVFVTQGKGYRQYKVKRDGPGLV